MAALACAACMGAQPTVSMHVTGRLQSAATTRRNLGRLPKAYRAADWTVTSMAGTPVRVPLARLLQCPQILHLTGMTVLSRISTFSVVDAAQSGSAQNRLMRIAEGVTGAAAGAEVAGIIPATGWGSYVVLGTGVATLLAQHIFPALKAHAVLSVEDMLPEVLSMDAFGTITGMILVETADRTDGELDMVVTIAGGDLEK